jgi:hypothetical protein
MSVENVKIRRMRLLPEELAAAAWVTLGHVPASVAKLVPEAIRESAVPSGIRTLFARNLAAIAVADGSEPTVTVVPDLRSLVEVLSAPSAGTLLAYTTASSKANFALFESDKGSCSVTVEVLGTLDVLLGPVGSVDEIRSILLPTGRFRAASTADVEAARAASTAEGMHAVLVECEEAADGGKTRRRYSLVGALS